VLERKCEAAVHRRLCVRGGAAGREDSLLGKVLGTEDASGIGSFARAKGLFHFPPKTQETRQVDITMCHADR